MMSNEVLPQAHRRSFKPSQILYLKKELFDRYEGTLPVVAVYALEYLVEKFGDRFEKLNISSKSVGLNDFERWLLDRWMEGDGWNEEAAKVHAKVSYLDLIKPHYDLISRSFADSESAWRFLTGQQSKG